MSAVSPQVLIAGAGPVGLTLAIELSRFGTAVRIVDMARSRTDKSKAVCIWSRTLELFNRAGLAEPLVSAGMKVGAANINAGAKKIACVDFAGIDTDYPFALMIPQSETERILEAHLKTLGVTVERSTELRQFTDTGSGVRASIQHVDGTAEEIDADWLVGCDGAHSVVRHSLGKTFDGDTVPEEFVLADIRLSGDGFPREELASFWHHSGIVVFFPLPENRIRLIASMEKSVGEVAPEPTLAEIQAIIDERGPGGLIASDAVWMARFRINERKVADYRSGRVFLAGDAAHIHSPAGGQGMNTGMQDAFNLAWKLALVSKGCCGEKLLESYSPERSAIAEKVIADAGRLTKVAMLSNAFEQNARNFIARHVLGFAKVRHAAAETFSELAVGYDTSPLNGQAARGLTGPLPGHRLSPQGLRPIGAEAYPTFAIFADQGAADGPVLRHHAGLLEPTIRSPLDVKGIWLVRPDGYVAMSARAGDWDAVGDYLDALA